jgi:hypothetical protein
MLHTYLMPDGLLYLLVKLLVLVITLLVWWTVTSLPAT